MRNDDHPQYGFIFRSTTEGSKQPGHSLDLICAHVLQELDDFNHDDLLLVPNSPPTENEIDLGASDLDV